MSANAEHFSDPELAAAVWDLEPLVDGGGPDGARRLLEDAAMLAADFAARHCGRVAALDAVALTAAMRELSAIRELTMRAFIYAQLWHEVELDDDAASALYQAVAERRLEIEQMVRFFELEWAALSPAEIERLLDSAGAALDFAAHHLRRIHDAGTELLSAPEERILAETAPTSRLAWTRLIAELCSAVRFEVDGEEVGVGAILSLREDSDRGLRRRAQEAFAAALESGLRTRAFAYNALLQGHATLDRVRGRGHWLALAAYARYRLIGEPFVEDYLAMLAAGGSRSPHQLAAMVGIDLNDPGFWNSGLDLIDTRLREAETLADAAYI